MARRKRKLKVRGGSESELPVFKLAPQTKRGIWIVIFALLAILSLLALFGSAGSVGRILNKILGLLLGGASIASPLIFFGVALGLFFAGRRERDQEAGAGTGNLRVYLGAALFTLALTGLLHVMGMHHDKTLAFELVKQGRGGGYFGLLFGYPLFSLVDFWASFLILIGVILISLVVIFDINVSELFRRSRTAVVAGEPLKINNHGVSDKVKINKLEPLNFNVSKVSQNRVVLRDVAAEDEDQVAPRSEKVLPRMDELARKQALPAAPSKFRKGNWLLPPVSLLEESHMAVDSGNIEANVSIIQKTLQDFGIEVEMGEVNVGPTVTQYTLRPAQGIKLSQIVTLQNDLALALAASSIRIEAPIPGRSLVGIEVPNKATAIVRLKDVVQTESFINHKSSLAFALGRDVAGHPMVADLAKMPHLLIAGATGTGKSVAINSLLISFLFRNSPEELRLIVIDPKRVELNLYNGIPHLLTPVVSDYYKAVNALKWAVAEMDRRYNLLAESNKRNILEYNAVAETKLPYIVIIVDELADLMAVAQADVEAAVVRLAQMARAVGVHLVLATQRPSVDIITGLIKANITARMAFAVASQVDSRTILDIAGAEKLLGSGDMLYITAELGKPKRVQGTYISEKEVKAVVSFLCDEAGEVKYSEEILEKPRGNGSAIPGFESADDDDDLLPEAIETVKRASKASASLLQRRLRIGYARAARLLDLMEEKGIIGPGEGAKPRDVYLSVEDDGMNQDNLGEDYQENQEEG